MPEGGVALPLSDSARFDENLGEVVELALLVDNISLIVHASLGVLVGKFCQLLP